MPSKRKSRTHIFQRSRTRSRRRSCSQPKGVKVVEEKDETSDLETSHENEDEISHHEHDEEEEIPENTENTNKEEEDVEIQNEEESECDNAQTKIQKKKTNKVSTPTKNNNNQLHGNEPSLNDDCKETKKQPTTYTKYPYKNYKKSPRRAHRYKSYSHEMLVAAYKCVKELKMPVKASARMFGVPSSTLHNRVQGQVQIDDSILTSEDVVRITEKLKNGEGLDDAFAGLSYEKSNGEVKRGFGLQTEEDDLNDDSLTESIMEKMNSSSMSNDVPTIKEEVVDPEYDNQVNGSDQINDESSVFTSPEQVDYQMSPAQEQLRRSYKRSYKTYSYEQLVAAYLYVKEKRVAVKFAARAFGVPPSTLNDRVQGKVFIDTSIVMNNPGGRKILPKPNLNRFSRINEKNNCPDSNHSSNIGSDDSAPPTPDTSDFSSSEVSSITKQVYDAMEGRPEFQNIFKKHKCRDQYRKYTPEQLMEACKYSIETKASYREVSEKFGIPQSTLRDKLHAVEKLNAADVGRLSPGVSPAKKARLETAEVGPEPTMVLCPEAPETDLDPNKLSDVTNDRSNYRQYSKDSLTTAAHYVMKFNTPIMKAARMFGVPASTLKDHVKNKMTGTLESVVLPTTPSLISDRDERKLIEYIKMMEKCGFVLTKKEIIDFGSELASASQEIEGSITLSDSWYIDFVKRWPPLGLVNREGRSPTPQDIKKYFTELNKVFNKHKFFERPELVYVMDEVDIALEYNPLKLVPGKRFDKSKTTQPTLTSVIGCSNALGTTLPPYYVLQSDEIVSDVIAQSPPGTQATFANSGPKDCSIVRDYFQNHFMRFAQSGRNTQNRFVLVFYDSRKTNLNVSDLEWAKRWHILLYPLPHPVKAENYYEMEAMDGMFKNYTADVEEERGQFVNNKGYMAVSMPDICGILGKAYRRSLTYEHIVSCFENWGIYPLNPKNYVTRLEASFQVKLQDLQAVPNYETNLWLLSDFGCTQAVNNAIESSFNSSYTNESNSSNSYYRNENNTASSNFRRQTSGTNISLGSNISLCNPGYNEEDTSFNASYQGLMNHLMGQAVSNKNLQEHQILNGVAIKTEPQMDLNYGNISMDSRHQIQNGYSQSQYGLERSVSSASEESQNTQNFHVVPEVTEMRIVQNGTSFSSHESCTSNYGATENTDNSSSSQLCQDNASSSLSSAVSELSSQITGNTGHVKNKCESSSSSRRKGKSYRVIVNEPEPETDKAETPPCESNVIFSKSKVETIRKSGKLGSLLDEKVRKLHEQAKASSEGNEDNDEPLMKVGDFQIVMNKGD